MQVARSEAARLARQIVANRKELDNNKRVIIDLVTQTVPELLGMIESDLLLQRDFILRGLLLGAFIVLLLSLL